MFLGIHCSVRQGYLAALEEAKALGCDAMQLLPYRRHHEPSREELTLFRAARDRRAIARVLVHSRFVPSPAAADRIRRRRSVELLTRELVLADALGADAYVLHVGAYAPASDWEEGLASFCRSLEEARAESGVRMPLAIENVAGGGRRMGGTLEELARILDAARRVWPEAFACLDTAHAWAAGTDLSAEGMEAFLEEVERRLGGASVAVWHLNDTLADRGSRVDSHWHLGEGRIGTAALGRLVAALAKTEATVIVETPRGTGKDRRNMDWVREAAGLGGTGAR